MTNVETPKKVASHSAIPYIVVSLFIAVMMIGIVTFLLMQSTVRFAITNAGDVRQAMEARENYNSNFKLDLKDQ